MKCKFCKSCNYGKNEYTNGLERYKCKDCKSNWTISRGIAYGKEIRLKALKLYLEIPSFRVVGHFLVRVIKKRIREIGEKLFQEGALWKNSDLKLLN